MRYATRALALLAVLAVPAVGGAQGGPIRIGLLAPLSGAFSATGKDMVVGTELYLDVRKVERLEGKLQNTVIAAFPGVGQFWKYSAEEYMKLPLYTRDSPPCKHC